MKKIVIVNLLFCFLFSSVVKAEKVDTTLAKTVAANFYLSKLINKKVQSVDLTLAYECKGLVSNTEEVGLYYVFNRNNPKGFVIIAAEDNVTPVLGYSTEGNYSTENQAPAFSEWMENYGQQIKYVIENKLEANKDIQDKWELYTTLNRNLETTEEVEPLLSTTWNQGCFYNDSCPEDPAGPCGKVFAGCVAIAQAQIMKYWDYPPHGKGSHSYSDSTYGVLSADFGSTTYSWDNMPNMLQGSSNPDISQFLYHVGVSEDMQYSAIGSGAPGNAPLSSLVNYFNYSSIQMNQIRKDDYNADEWSNILIKELNSGRPIYYVGWGTTNPGHAFVCDGYNSNDYFHFNWGWGGAYDGYFYLNELTAGNYNFNLHNYCIIGIKPQTTPISVLKPNGNELWEPDSTVSIYWEDTIAENVRFELYKSDTLYTTIITSTPSDGEFDWIIPNEIQDDSNYKLKITSAINEEFFDYSNNSFSINKVPHVISPNGGESWKTFDTKLIKWKDVGRDVSIELAKRIGNTYNYYSTITDSATGGIYKWQIPWDHNIGRYQVKIIDNYNDMAYDYGDGNFTLYGVYSFYTDINTLFFGSEEGAFKTFNIKSRVGWQITDHPNWIDVSDTSGVGDRTITLTTNCKNETGSVRYDTVRINCLSPCSLSEIKVLISQDLDVSAIYDKFINHKITIYPNPANSAIFIEISDLELIVEKIELLDLTSTVLVYKKIDKTADIIEITVNDLEPGLCFIKLYTSEGILTKKILIQR